MTFMVDLNDPADIERVSSANHRLVERALEFRGTCSGEHRLGTGKLKYLDREQRRFA